MCRIISKRSMKNKFRLYLCLCILWMIVIFLFSAQNADESSSLSNGIFFQLAQLFHIPDTAMQTMTFLIRKAAHASEYGLLAILFYLLYGETKFMSYRYMCALLSAFLYACTDEFHQLFVPGRAGLMQDVLIDTSGACIALLLVYGFLHLQKSIRKQKIQHD